MHSNCSRSKVKVTKSRDVSAGKHAITRQCMVISTSNLVGIIDVGVDALIIPTKFEVDMTINCRVTAFV